MVQKNKAEWRPVQLPKELVDEVEKILETDLMKKKGYTSISQFITRSVNHSIEEYEQKRLRHSNTYDDKVRILDNNIGKMGDIVTVFLKDSEKKGFCDYCESDNCIHVKFMWELPDVVKILKKRGFNSPYD